jgi:tetratricopeptide (TPR) repeat protein
MSFDKLQAMRNAERHVLQGKIRAAIAEYKNVVENDPRDFATLNMLGDLYVKNSEKKAAVECYKAVAEHYHKQGFSQKAIAIYKKVSRLEPNSVEISAKLAELYQVKGSLSEARSHYTTLADHYRSQGKIIEALTILKQIAVLDPNDTEVFVKLAESYLQENQEDEAADAYSEAGGRLFRAMRYEEASKYYLSSLELKPGSINALDGFVKVQNQLGRAGEAARMIEDVLAKQPYNREALCLLVECHLAANNAAEAEHAIVRLVEHEPANYPRFLDLARSYLDAGDLASASRAISLCIENLLIGGQKAECRQWIDEILGKDPEQLGGLRLLARVASWERDDRSLLEALTKLNEVSNRLGSVEDERYALSQLVMIVPNETAYADRLRELNELHGYSDNPYDEALLRNQFDREDAQPEAPAADGLDILNKGGKKRKKKAAAVEEASDAGFSIVSSNGVGEAFEGLERGTHQVVEEPEPTPVAEAVPESAPVEAVAVVEAVSSVDDESAIAKEIESIRFYIQNGYKDLARMAIDELVTAHGARPEFESLEDELCQAPTEDVSEDLVEPATAAEPAPVAAEPAKSNGNGSKRLDLDELRSEFGLEDSEPPDDSDYETHYQMAVAYQEMGLMEDAIKEFQDAINLVTPGDAKRRFFQCANLMGHCFMQNGMAKLALKWFNRALETPNLSIDEKMGIWYELAMAHDADGDHEHAARFFEQVYAEDVDYRDIAERMRNVMVTA